MLKGGRECGTLFMMAPNVMRVYVSVMLARTQLHQSLRSMGRVLLGYSGGVDSAVLAVAGAESLGPDRFLAVIGRSPSYPESQYQQARTLAEQFAVPLLEMDTHELDDRRYAANPTNRCYFCKTELWSVLGRVARDLRFDTIIDGTNADDLGEHRPGLGAAQEQRVRSPLVELGWSKSQVREVARAMGLPVWDAPASPCLSSRIQYGLAVTPERLRQVEQAEAFLRELGVAGDLRVRHQDSRARIEVAPQEFERLRAGWDKIETRLAALGFSRVDLDPRGYRRGSMLAVLASS